MNDDRAFHHPHEDLDGAAPGDWLEVDRVGGGPRRRGQILEVLRSGRGVRFRVRWNEESETLHFPGHGDRLVKRGAVLHR